MNRIDVENVLLKIGIPVGIKGFKYIVDAVLIMDETDIWSVTKELYPDVAKINKTTASSIERAIRHAFAIARSPKGNYDEVEKYIGFMNCENGNSLKMLHMRLKQEMEQKEKEIMYRKMDDLAEDKFRQIVREELRVILGGLC